MTKLTTIDREAAKRLAALTKEALAGPASDLGLTVTLGRGTFDPEAGTYEVRVKYALGDAERILFAREADLFGLQADDYGAVISLSGRQVRLVGFNLRARSGR